MRAALWRVPVSTAILLVLKKRFIGIRQRAPCFVNVVSDPAYWRPAEPIPLVGDFSRAQNTLGWAPSVSFDELVNLLVAADLEDGATEPPNRSS